LQSVFFYLGCSHYREAVKALEFDLKKPDVKGFVDRLDVETLKTLKELRSGHVPWQGSFVERRLYPLRNCVFHYFSDADGDVELMKALSEVALKDSGIRVGSFMQTRFYFADEIMSVQAGRVLADKDGEEGLKEVITKLPGLIMNYLNFSHAAVEHYLAHPWNARPRSGPPNIDFQKSK
jgi:hypothetical protein